MAEIPFDIKFKPQVESGEYKVETRDGRSVRIICWDAKGLCPIIYLLSPTGFGGASIENPCHCTNEGNYCNRATCQDEDLFIVTPEPEMSEFENELSTVIGFAIAQSISSPNEEMVEFVKIWSERLLSLARKQLQPEIDAEIAKAYKNADEVMYRKGKEDGIAEARNDISARIIALKQAKDRAEEALKKLQRCEDKESSIKTGDRVLIHCKSTRDEAFKHIYDNQEGKVLHIWDLKRNPWGNIHVKIEGGYNNGFLLEELEKLPRFKEDEK